MNTHITENGIIEIPGRRPRLKPVEIDHYFVEYRDPLDTLKLSAMRKVIVSILNKGELSGLEKISSAYFIPETEICTADFPLPEMRLEKFNLMKNLSTKEFYDNLGNMRLSNNIVIYPTQGSDIADKLKHNMSFTQSNIRQYSFP